jgi:hypothetical protein
MLAAVLPVAYVNSCQLQRGGWEKEKERERETHLLVAVLAVGLAGVLDVVRARQGSHAESAA